MQTPQAVTESAITLPCEAKFITRYSTIEMPPIASVETVGIRYFGCILREAVGQRLVDRHRQRGAGGRQDRGLRARRPPSDSTIRISRWVKKLPNQALPKTALPRTESTSPELSGLPRPMPLSPTPAKICADERHQRRRSATSRTVEMIAARPGVLRAVLGLLVHRDRAVPAPVDEQHQQHRADEGRERADVERVEPGELRAAGGRGRVAGPNRISAVAEKMTSMVASRPSSAVWMRAESSMPR